MKKILKSKEGISPILATLLLIVIAVAASQQQRELRGEVAELASERVEGSAIAVLGHRQDDLSSIEGALGEDRLRARLVEILTAKKELDPRARVLTGLRRGAEAGAELLSGGRCPAAVS